MLRASGCTPTILSSRAKVVSTPIVMLGEPAMPFHHENEPSAFCKRESREKLSASRYAVCDSSK